MAASLNLEDCMNIPDSFDGYSTKMFCIPKHYEDYIDKVLMPHGMIQDRIEKLAADIFHDMIDHQEIHISAVCVLKGGYKFFSELLNKLNTLNTTSGRSVPISIDFIKVKSYVDTASSGEVQILGMDNLVESLKNKNVLIVEDMIDTGRTMKKLLKTMQKYEPKTLKVACLMRKRTPLSDGYAPDYVGFEIPDKFLIGYALDYNEYFRDLSHICTINPAGIEKFKANA
jgi:hypoxanthine phosphoribosyltransferase